MYFGTYYEQILTFIKAFLQDGSFLWESRRGVIYGPFSPIYGFGAVLMTYFLAKKEYSWKQVFFYGALMGGAFEYLVSFLQETFVGTLSWDYQGYFLNIHGRTTVPFMFFWGLCCLIYVKGIYPFVNKWIEEIPVVFGTRVTRIMVVLMCCNMFVSWTALLRQTMRRNDIGPFTPVGKFYDQVYTDEFLKQYFPNMMISNK